MKVFMFLLPVLLGAVAHADMIKPASLDVVCTNTSDSRVIKIVSDKEGSVVFVNGKKILQREQLIAGTEGGPAYLQAVGGGYNITISGDDFDKAFNASSTIEQGQALTSIWDSSSKKSVKGICKGSFSF